MVVAEHGVPASFLLCGLGFDLGRQAPGPGPDSLGQGKHAQGVAFVVRSLSPLQKDVPLHRAVASLLRPLGRTVTPKASTHRFTHISIQPCQKLRDASTDGQQFPPDSRRNITSSLLHCRSQFEHSGQWLRRTRRTVVRHVHRELAVEVTDHLDVEVSPGFFQCGGEALLLLLIQSRPRGAALSNGQTVVHDHRNPY
ncbi:hypothetical protein AOZ06_44125 [Kibdelosporangium phytohabitans]|uniref:Uncharacterized protein n=1 Tax=Kibdelosporangium phytohabitans TaxID=860235 RepID=A0A0N9ICI1_9PSEU|nr:hypothetical protein AOZ06_44125 [Kibdelosporangium phytohabitans]